MIPKIEYRNGGSVPVIEAIDSITMDAPDDDCAVLSVTLAATQDQTLECLVTSARIENDNYAPTILEEIGRRSLRATLSAQAESPDQTPKIASPGDVNRGMNDTHQPPPIMTVPQLAKYAGCGPSTIYKIIDNGSLAAFALNPESNTRKNWRIYLKSWEAFVGAQATSRNGPLV